MRRFLFLFAALASAGEWQLTYSPISKSLDNNDNFSRDDRFLVYDTRDTLGPGPANSASIMKVSVITGLESYLYRPPSVQGDKAAPGVLAASFHPITDEAIFIHGPLMEETARVGFYGVTNRRGAIVSGDGTGAMHFVDCRDVASETTPPGAHRGGTHRHEFSGDGQRIGFTYDDHLVTTHARNLGILVPHAKAPCGVSHYFAVLLPIVPAASAKAGDLIRAADDSWVGPKGLTRAFIGTVKEADGSTGIALFAVDIPATFDITTADAGTKTRYPSPPKGLTVRRLTRAAQAGLVRGSADGRRIAYYDKDSAGRRQVFVIDASGTNKTPAQVTTFDKGVTGGVRWHASGNSIAVLSDNGVAAVCVKAGPLFGKSVWLTAHGAEVRPAEALVWSHKGNLLAFNRRVGVRQIFLAEFPDANGNGIADAIE